MRFGYGHYDENSPSVWGARAIFMHKQEYMDLLPDRQSFEGTDQIIWLMNEGGILKMAQKKFAELVRDGVITTRESKEVVLFEDSIVKVIGNSNASWGYFYVDAWVKPLPDVPVVATSAEMDRVSEEAGAEPTGKNLVWRNEWLEPGRKIHVRINNLGPGKVLGHMHEHGFIFACVHLTDPPDWWERQRAEQEERTERHGTHYCYIMGHEWREIEEVA
jgi:hypothetical protein